MYRHEHLPGVKITENVAKPIRESQIKSQTHNGIMSTTIINSYSTVVPFSQSLVQSRKAGISRALSARSSVKDEELVRLANTQTSVIHLLLSF